MAVDLHLHSLFSDGSDSPTEIVNMAAGAGLTGIALTDHDILDGIPEAAAAAFARQIRFVGGTELSVLWQGQSMHMLVYFLEPAPGPLQDRLGRRSRHEAGNSDQQARENHSTSHRAASTGVGPTREQ